MKYYLLIVCSCLSFAALSQDNEMQRFISLLEEKNKEVESLECDFSQVQEVSFLDEVLESSGKFYFKKPGAMRWEQQQPAPYSFVISPTGAYSFDGNQKKSMPANSPQLIGFKKFIMGTIDGSVFSGDDFKNTVSFTSGKVNVVMIPQKKSVKKIFEKVEMTFDEETLYLTVLKFYETEVDVRSMYFSGQKTNTIADLTLFE